MIKKFLSRYNTRYPRSLVYMLQASEYDIRDYLAWYHRTKDFTHVERRKSLIATPKALLLLSMSWTAVFFFLGSAVFAVWVNASLPIYILLFIVLLFLPYILAYGIIVPLFIARVFVQGPVEYLIVNRAKQKLKSSHAVKIAIAGSFGKTTMREILKTVVSAGKKVAAPPHSYNTPPCDQPIHQEPQRR